jgi:FkbM family methyltransferase
VRGGIADGARWSLFPNTAYWRGAHEPRVQARLADLLDWRGRSVWDLGAHFGLFSIGLARRVGPAGHVSAFEPLPENFSRLRLHALRNNLPWLRLFPFAVSDRPARLSFVLPQSLENTTGHLPYEGESLSPAIPTLAVPAIRLDDLVTAGAVEPPHFIKLDVEGHGHHALRGGATTIRHHLPLISVGLHSEHEIRGIAELLLPLGYRYEPLDPASPAPLTVGADYLFLPPST